MTRFSARTVANAPRLLAIALMVVGWEIAAYLAPKSPLAQTAIVPSFADIFGPALLGMADYWKFPFWAPVTSAGGEQTLLGALLALAYHSLLTFFRLAVGLCLGMLVGVTLGLAIAWSPFMRHATLVPLSIFRMVPLLAMIPLFQFWVGTNSQSVIAFVAIGTGSVFVIGTINAVSNVPARYVDYARTLGTPRLAIYARVVFPAILPELWSSLLLSLGLAWSAVIAGEYVGIDTGLGRILTFAQFMSQTGRMALVAILVTFYAGLSYLACHAVARRVLAWRPTSGN